MKRKSFELDASDWPLLITESRRPFRIVATIFLPHRSTGTDKAGRRAVAVAQKALSMFNGGS